MASIIYNSFLDDVFGGAIDCDADTFKAMLVGSGYLPNKDGHTRRSDVSDEVEASGTYLPGGASVEVRKTKDLVHDREDISLGSLNFSAATITAKGAVYYKSRGGAASADELVAYIDFGGEIRSTNGNFSLTSSILRIQN